MHSWDALEWLVFNRKIHIPSGTLTQLWNIAISNGKTHYNWPFSIAMLVITRSGTRVAADGAPLGGDESEVH